MLTAFEDHFDAVAVKASEMDPETGVVTMRRRPRRVASFGTCGKGCAIGGRTSRTEWDDKSKVKRIRCSTALLEPEDDTSFRADVAPTAG